MLIECLFCACFVVLVYLFVFLCYLEATLKENIRLERTTMKLKNETVPKLEENGRVSNRVTQHKLEGEYP